MATRMLIDATHSEETRVVVVRGNRVEEFDFENATRKQLKSNIYLAKVTRVEPSLQAAFVDYGGNRHGFLAFNEIHTDYYQLPSEDRDSLIREERDAAKHEAARDDIEAAEDHDDDEVEALGVADEIESMSASHQRLRRKYRIQQVIRPGQVMLVQVVKEERGNKGAALTTYISLAGRYCVLMPNTARGGGVSRKISKTQDRRRLKGIVSELDVPEGIGVIVRTAGANRSKPEIRRDYEYLLKLWNEVREKTLASKAPASVHEEANLIRRCVRDLYTKEMDEILVAGEDGYRAAKDFMKALIPSHAVKVQPYRDPIPLFQRYQVEQALVEMHSQRVELRSGGYLIFDQTEALVAIDVNSGRATREKNIEETALKTNLEAAEEVARQVRLRDLAGLVVIDFIDMDEPSNNRAVERKLKECLKLDRARVQVGRISPFGLMEMSRQRLRPSIMEVAGSTCPYCNGTGIIRSTDSAALHVMRAIEEEGLRNRSDEIVVYVPLQVALYILNNKRDKLKELEELYSMSVIIEADHDLVSEQFRIDRTKTRPQQQQQRGKQAAAATTPTSTTTEEPKEAAAPAAATTGDAEEDEGDNEGGRRRRRRRRRGRRGSEAEDRNQDNDNDNDAQTDEDGDAAAEGQDSGGYDDSDDDDDSEGGRRRRRRGRRGGRRRRRQRDGEDQDMNADFDGDSEADSQEEGQPQADEPVAAAEESTEAPAAEAQDQAAPAEEAPAEAPAEQPVAEEAPVEAPAAVEAEAEAPAPVAEAPAEPEAVAEPEPVIVAEPEPETRAIPQVDSRIQVIEITSGEEQAEEEGPKKRGWWSR